MTRSQRLLAAFFNFAGTMHFLIPRSYEATVPKSLPITPQQAVRWSGYAEIAGGLAVIPERSRGFARWWLLGLLAAVFPANVNMAVNPAEAGRVARDTPSLLLWLRLPIQGLICIWVWRATER